MRLGFTGTGSDGRPADQVRHILGNDRFQDLRRSWHFHFRQLDQQFPGKTQTFFDVERLVQIRVIDQTFPPDGGTGLFKVGAHDHKHLVLNLRLKLLQVHGIFHGGRNAVDGTGTADHQDPFVTAGKNIFRRRTGGINMLGDLSGQGQFGKDLTGRGERKLPHNVDV